MWHKVQSLSRAWCCSWQLLQSTEAALRSSPCVWHVEQDSEVWFSWRKGRSRWTGPPTERFIVRCSTCGSPRDWPLLWQRVQSVPRPPVWWQLRQSEIEVTFRPPWLFVAS